MEIVCRLCCCCFKGVQSASSTIGLLKSNSQQQSYTVHKISSFGKTISNDEDGNISAPTTPPKNRVIIANAAAAWNSKPILVQPSTENELSVSECEEGSRSLQASPAVKKKSRWSKALLKTKPKKETGSSYNSMANVSMMLLPTITVANSSSSPSSLMALDVENSLKKNDEKFLTAENSPKGGTWLKSQSMLNVNYVSDNENVAAIDDQSSTLARKYGLDTSLYRSAAHLSKSTEAVNKAWKSMDDFTGESNFVDLPMGTIHFIASYNKHKLQIRVCKIEGLAPKGEDRTKYNCILKLAMLPNEKHIRHSRIISAHSTLNIDERFIFTVRNVISKVLRISVYPAAYQDKYDAVGHALFYVEDALSNSQDPHIMKLYKQSTPGVEAGSIQVTLKYEKEKEILNVAVNRGHNLPSYSGKCKTYIKLLQYNSGRKVRVCYSSSVTAKSEVKYNYNVDLKIEPSIAANTYVVINAKVKGFFKKDTVMGRIILGPFFYAEYGQKLTPWGRLFLKEELVSYTFRMYL